MRKKIIYDFGANNGDDIPYYLNKADLVVAVEADPSLCKIMNDRFQNEILSKRLVIENIVIAVDQEAEVPFFIHKTSNVLNQFPEPSKEDSVNYEKVYLPARSPVSIIHEYGAPLYIKIDVEGYDKIILQNLFSNNIRPPYISAESHSIDVFCILIIQGGYESFKLVEGKTVQDIYRNIIIKNDDGGFEAFSFPFHSAGPFGDDIKGEWYTPENCMKLLAYSGLGWKDLHATNVVDPASQKRMKFRHIVMNQAKERFLKKLRKLHLLP